MTFDEFDKSYDSLIKETLKMRDTKGKEYCGSEDRLANFKRAGEAIGIDPIKVLYVYMCKHWDSISSYVKGNREGLSEPIRGRIVDLITYAGLLNGLIEENKQKTIIAPVEAVRFAQPYAHFVPQIPVTKSISVRCSNIYGGKQCKLSNHHEGKHKR